MYTRRPMCITTCVKAELHAYIFIGINYNIWHSMYEMWMKN